MQSVVRWTKANPAGALVVAAIVFGAISLVWWPLLVAMGIQIALSWDRDDDAKAWMLMTIVVLVILWVEASGMTGN